MLRYHCPTCRPADLDHVLVAQALHGPGWRCSCGHWISARSATTSGADTAPRRDTPLSANWERDRTIRAAYAAGYTTDEIASMVGLSARRVQQILGP